MSNLRLVLALALVGTPHAFGGELRLGSSGPRLQLDAYGQLDGRFLSGWDVTDRIDPPDDPSFDVPRLRVGVSARWRALSGELQGDLVDGGALKDAWLGVRLFRALGLRAGHQKLPVSGEWLTSPRRIDFIRRSEAVESLAPGRDWGVALRGELERVEYEAGVFAGDGWDSRTRSAATVAARLAVAPVRGLWLAGSCSFGHVDAAPLVDGAAGDARGLKGVSASGFTYFERKYVDGRRLRAGAEAAWRVGPVSLKGEYLEQRDDRTGQGPLLEDLPAVRGRGWAASLTWLLAGERKKARVRAGSAFPHGAGALEAAARLDGLRWDDTGAAGAYGGVASRSRDLRPQGVRAFTGGLSWWPVDWVRVIGNVIVERYDDALVVPLAGQRSYTTVLTRLQLELP